MTKNYESRVHELVDHFSSLVQYTEKLAFPDYKDGILAPKDTTAQSFLGKFLNRITHVTWSEENPGLLNIFIFIIWAYASAASLALGIVFIQPNLYNLSFPTIQPYSLVNDPATTIITSILVIMVMPVAIYWWYEIITEKRYAIVLKLFLLAIFLYLFYELIAKLDLNNTMVNDWLNLKSGLLRAFLLHFAPAVTYFLAIGFDVFTMVYHLLEVLFGGVRSVHNPLPFNEIKKLLTEDIQNESTGKPWKISELSDSEVEQISKWASTNRDATVPISIFLGLLGIISISNFAQSKADNFIANWLRTLGTIYQSPFSVPLFTSVFNLGLFFLVFIFIALVVMSLIRLFVNLAVQNIIIEACIVAQFGAQDSRPNEAESAKQGNHRDKKHAFSPKKNTRQQKG